MIGRAFRQAAAAGVALLAGCTVGPDWEAPKPETPDHWSAGSASQLKESEPDPRWWEALHDPELSSLIERAVAGNIGYQQAILRVESARLAVDEARSNALPSLKAAGSYNRDQFGVGGVIKEQGGGSLSGGSSSQSGLTSLVSDPIDFYQVGFDASWELDLFGRVRRAEEQAGAESESQAETRNDAEVSLEAEIADTYVQLRSAQAESDLTTDTIRIESDLLDLTKRLSQNGLTSELDLQTVAARLSTTRARLPVYDQQQAAAMNRLSLLLGLPPGSLDGELHAAHALPPTPPEIAVGVPSTLARRRPDIRRAEAELHASIAAEGFAIAALYPDISLTGQVGTRAVRAKYLDRWSNLFYSVGPAISLPIFEGGRLETEVTSSKIDVRVKALGYRQTVLSALEEVDDQMTSLRSDQDRRPSLTESEQRLTLAFDLAQARSRNGLASAIEVRDSERSLIDARDELLHNRVAIARDLIRLYKALGGGWQSDDAAGAVNPPVSTDSLIDKAG